MASSQTVLSIRCNALPCMLFTVLLSVAMAKVGFQKDLKMDAKFPPPVFRPDPSIPEGHMRPLGWQRMTDGPVEEVEGPVSTIEFYNDFVAHEMPVVMRQELTTNAAIFDNWKEDSYLVNQFGQVNVSVRVKLGRHRGRVRSQSQVMSVKKFISDYKYEEWYLSSVLPVEMMEEVPLPPSVRCGTISERLWSPLVWMSSGGTSSRVHSHADHLVHCVLFGRRDFIVMESRHKKAFDFVPDYSGSIGGHSDINAEMIDMFQFSQVARVPWTWSSLKPGDCIFVPAGYVHQVRSYGRSISTTIEFSPMKVFDDTGCTLGDEEFAPMTDAFFQWNMDNGKLVLRNRNMNADDLRNLLLCLMGKGDAITFHRFDHFYSTISATAEKAPTARHVFDMMTPRKNQLTLTEPNLLGISVNVLSKIAEVFNSFHKKTKQNKASAKTSGTKDKKGRARVKEEF